MIDFPHRIFRQGTCRGLGLQAESFDDDGSVMIQYCRAVRILTRGVGRAAIIRLLHGIIVALMFLRMLEVFRVRMDFEVLPRMCGLNESQRRKDGCPEGTKSAQISHSTAFL